MSKTPTENLIAFLEQDKVIPVIGAGVSAAVADLPGWKRAIENGFEFALHRSLNGEAIVKGKNLLEQGSLTESADILKRLLNSPKNPFATWLDQLFGQPVIRDKKLLTNIHKLCCPMILTTNYDNLIFKTLIVGQKQVFDWSEFQEVHRSVVREEEFILHLHGRINKPETVILSREDYRQLAEQSGYKAVLQSLWMNYHFLFIGCSKDGVLDDDFITILNFLKEWFPTNPHQHFMLVNEANIKNGEHESLLFDCNIESISFGNDYAQLPVLIEKINPNKERLEAKIKKLFETYLNGETSDPLDVGWILKMSKRYRELQEKLNKLKKEFEEKKGGSYFDKDLYEEIQKVEALITKFKQEVSDLLSRYPDIKARFGEGDVDEVIINLQREDLEERARQLEVENKRLSAGRGEMNEKLKQLALDYLLRASLVFVNVEDPDRAERARQFVDKALATFEDADILDQAGRFYKIKLRLPKEGVALLEKMILLNLDLVRRMASLYTIGTMYMDFDEESASKHLAKFCSMAENLKVNHPYLQTLYANGLHNLASSISDEVLKASKYAEALAVRRSAAKADPIYLSSLVFTANMVCSPIRDAAKFEATFDEALDAMEAFLRLDHVEPVVFFEDNCLAGLIVLSLKFGAFGMREKFDRLKSVFEGLLPMFDDYVVEFQPEHGLGAGTAYHQYFLTFSDNKDFAREEFQWMVDRSIVHFKQSMKYFLPDDRLYFMLAYSLSQKYIYKKFAEHDIPASLLFLKEALSCCRSIKNPDEKGKWLLDWILSELAGIEGTDIGS